MDIFDWLCNNCGTWNTVIVVGLPTTTVIICMGCLVGRFVRLFRNSEGDLTAVDEDIFN